MIAINITRNFKQKKIRFFIFSWKRFEVQHLFINVIHFLFSYFNQNHYQKQDLPQYFDSRWHRSLPLSHNMKWMRSKFKFHPPVLSTHAYKQWYFCYAKKRENIFGRKHRFCTIDHSTLYILFKCCDFGIGFIYKW